MSRCCLEKTKEKLKKLICKGNVLIEGPPGTGKSTLVYKLHEELPHFLLITATADSTWTVRDLIGGPYLKNVSEVWRSGILVKALFKALVRKRPVLLFIDEVNRCDVDKVFGLFFSVFLSPRPEDWDFRPLIDYLEEQKSRFGELDAWGEGVLLHLISDPKAESIRKYFRMVVAFNTVDYATTFQVGEAFRRRFYPLLVKNDINEVEELLKNSSLKEDYKQKLKEFLRRLYDEAGYHNPLPIYIAHVKTFLELYETLGDFKEAFCAVFINPALELDYENCERVNRALKEVFKDELPCELRCLS